VATTRVRAASGAGRQRSARAHGRFARGVAGSVLLLTLSSGVFGCSLFSSPAPPPPPPPAPVEPPTPKPFLLLSLGERRLYVKEEGAPEPLASYRVAIGRKQFPTPTGEFRINEMVENPDFLIFDFSKPDRPPRGRIPPGPNNPLGLRWIAFAHAHGWTIGFHGTAKTSVLGQAVSHGCVRMSNQDILKVYERVKLGTTVIVEP